MSTRLVRIGIDVGGTFTDAVALDNETFEVVAQEKVLTTHDSKQGVAEGIVQAIAQVLEKGGIDPQNVTFIAHGTTQATNALLEGDVAKVGIIGMGSGAEMRRAAHETTVGTIELAPGKFLCTEHEFIDSTQLSDDTIAQALATLSDKNCDAFVASESYSVDDPRNEEWVQRVAADKGLMTTAGHEISQLYGLAARTRTAAVNASLIPRMMETANMTESAVTGAGIGAPLMVMRCDGGVMSVDEVRRRPILTMLSGLAAGVAGALMYERVTDGIFLEAGGTSTDISVIKDGRVMIKNARVGGHRLYVTSLDIRTLGVAGGSMIVVEGGRIVDVGPRSAHIAGCDYEVFTSTSDLAGARAEFIAPCADDKPCYAVVRCNNDQSYALTLAGAANLLGYVPEEDYARGNNDAARLAWKALAQRIGGTAEELCKQAVDIASHKVAEVVRELADEYDLGPELLRLVGGGGSASVVVPPVAEFLKVEHGIVHNAPYISTMGVALALVREQIERSIANPTDEDIKRIRHDVTEAVVRAGASEQTVEVTIEVDAQHSILRATATGATELRAKDRTKTSATQEEIKALVADSAGVAASVVSEVAQAGRWHAFVAEQESRSLFGLIKSTKQLVRVADDEGVIRLRRSDARIASFECEMATEELARLIEHTTTYSDAGARLPKVFLFFGQRMVDLSGAQELDQLMSIAALELECVEPESTIIAVAARD